VVSNFLWSLLLLLLDWLNDQLVDRPVWHGSGVQLHQLQPIFYPNTLTPKFHGAPKLWSCSSNKLGILKHLFCSSKSLKYGPRRGVLGNYPPIPSVTQKTVHFLFFRVPIAPNLATPSFLPLHPSPCESLAPLAVASFPGRRRHLPSPLLSIAERRLQVSIAAAARSPPCRHRPQPSLP
jgi:hypothetical protein